MKANEIEIIDGVGVLWLDDGMWRTTFSLEDLELVQSYRWYWHITRRAMDEGYVTATKDKKTIRLHRLVTNCPIGYVTDHINGDTTNNTRENLRIISPLANCHNRQKNRNNSSGYKGVVKVGEKYVTSCQTENHRESMTTELTPEFAGSMYDLMLLMQRGPENVLPHQLNHPEEWNNYQELFVEE
jgi:hypothetical protein